jgi:hypothetical protein
MDPFRAIALIFFFGQVNYFVVDINFILDLFCKNKIRTEKEKKNLDHNTFFHAACSLGTGSESQE